MKVSWASEVVEYLCDCKRRGQDFDESWRRAMREFPVRGQGWKEIEAADLFEAAEEGESAVSFLHRACSDAWFGRRPALGHLRVILDSEGDDSLTYFRFRPGRS